MTIRKKHSVKCDHCGKVNRFDQPYAYHAGIADQGFLYNDSGTLTFVYSAFDPVFIDIFPDGFTWFSNPQNRQRFEEMLLPAPNGGRWRFRNPARCTHCREPISGSSLDTVVYLVYPGSVITDDKQPPRLKDYLKLAA